MKEGLPLGRTTQQNSLTSKELIEQINPDNKELLQEFISYLKSIDRAKTTVYQYEQDLNTFFVWNLQNNKNKFFVDIVKKDYVRYQGHLINENGNSPKRVRRIKSVIRTLSKYIEDICDDQYPNFRTIINKIESPVNEAVREKTIVDKTEVENLLKMLVDQGQFQKACLFALAAYSGARKNELLRFKVNYFDPENIVYDSLYKTPEKILTKGRSKGKYLFKYVIAADFDPYLKLWLEQRKQLNIDSEWLFVTKNGDSWIQTKASTVDKWAEKLSETMGIPIYLHMYRHFFTSELKRFNIPNSVITEIIGWAGEAMIQIYNDATIDDELGKYFDEGGIKKDIKEGKISDLK